MIGTLGEPSERQLIQEGKRAHARRKRAHVHPLARI